MRRRAVLAAGLAMALPLPAAAANRYAQGLLWRVDKSGIEPSHLFGTLHAGDPRLEPLPPPVHNAFSRSRALMLEYVADQYGRERFLEAALYLDGHTLVQDIGSEHFERAVEAMRPVGLPRDVVGKLKPWGVFLNLRISRQPTGTVPPDAQLFALARKRRLPVSQIENVEEQVFTFDEMSMASQVALLRHYREHGAELDQLAERTLRAYLARDLAGIRSAQQDYAHRYPEIAPHHAELMKRVVLDRSVVMAFRMQRELRRGRAFVAVGALHLYGDRGVLALLGEDGYRAERVY
ncbi:MAG: TraB/GumN family protein [Betaproteobacteria bacterium]|nr:TraB/GumN family protein [Betaproteobacteria bacterium]